MNDGLFVRWSATVQPVPGCAGVVRGNRADALFNSDCYRSEGEPRGVPLGSCLVLQPSSLNQGGYSLGSLSSAPECMVSGASSFGGTLQPG